MRRFSPNPTRSNPRNRNCSFGRSQVAGKAIDERLEEGRAEEVGRWTVVRGKREGGGDLIVSYLADQNWPDKWIYLGFKGGGLERPFSQAATFGSRRSERFDVSRASAQEEVLLCIEASEIQLYSRQSTCFKFAHEFLWTILSSRDALEGGSASE